MAALALLWQWFCESTLFSSTVAYLSFCPLPDILPGLKAQVVNCLIEYISRWRSLECQHLIDDDHSINLNFDVFAQAEGLLKMCDAQKYDGAKHLLVVYSTCRTYTRLSK